MNPNIQHLHAIATKKERLILGLMSGTSFDGLDLALCAIRNSGAATELKLKEFTTVPFDAEFKTELKSIFSRRDADLQKVCLMNASIALKHADIINDCLKKWKIKNESVDLIASHGQTIYHAPKWMHGEANFPNATLQIGDGDHLAVKTGIITISDFRQKHIAAGGEGAPLAVYGDFLVFSKQGEDRIMLNIGGIANFTFLPGDNDFSKVFSTDVGPGNTMMDAFVQKHFPGKYFDENGAIASAGKVNNALLEELSSHPFFKNDFPKTTGPEVFNLDYLEKAQHASHTTDISVNDVLATLNRFSATMISDALKRTLTGKNMYTIYSSGGGMHNKVLMYHLRSELPGVVFRTTADLNIHPDAKEAVLFALLANECVAGEANKKTGARNGIPGVTMGKISLPG